MTRRRARGTLPICGAALEGFPPALGVYPMSSSNNRHEASSPEGCCTSPSCWASRSPSARRAPSRSGISTPSPCSVAGSSASRRPPSMRRASAYPRSQAADPSSDFLTAGDASFCPADLVITLGPLSPVYQNPQLAYANPLAGCQPGDACQTPSEPLHCRLHLDGHQQLGPRPRRPLPGLYAGAARLAPPIRIFPWRWTVT